MLVSCTKIDLPIDLPQSENKVWVSKPLSCCDEKWSQFVKEDVYEDLKLSKQGNDYYLSEIGSHAHLYTKEDLEFNQNLIDESIKDYFSDNGITIYDIKRVVTNKEKDRLDYDGLPPTKIYFQIDANSFYNILKINQNFVLEK